MRTVQRFGRLLCGASVALLICSEAWSQSLTWLGTLDGFSLSEARDVSADGSVVVGWSSGTSGNARAFRWRLNDGMTSLSEYAGLQTYAYGVSADGASVVGVARASSGITYALHWNASGEVHTLEAPSGVVQTHASGVSADGSRVVGYARNSEGVARAFHWTQDDGMQLLGAPDAEDTYAFGISGDGTSVVGSVFFSPDLQKAFRWSLSGAAAGLGAAGASWGEAYAASWDGSLIVGAVHMDGHLKACYWTADGQIQVLDTPGHDSVAYDVSADGQVIVGERDGRAFAWTPTYGILDLSAVYINLLPPGSMLTKATAVSLNGRFVVGQGYNSQTGRYEGFLLDTIPEPSTLLALAVGLGGLAVRRRRNRGC
jgi:probable HAF family extracellular repeat protein